VDDVGRARSLPFKEGVEGEKELGVSAS
jgi:hypothetical protein